MSDKNSKPTQGKGSAPRNNYSKQFRDNYDAIKWSKTDDKPFEKKMEENITKLKQRMEEARNESEYAYWTNRPLCHVERLMEIYSDARREYENALELFIIENQITN